MTTGFKPCATFIALTTFGQFLKPLGATLYSHYLNELAPPITLTEGKGSHLPLSEIYLVLFKF